MTAGADQEPGLVLAAMGDRRLTRAALTAHASGAVTVAVFLIFLLPAARSSHSGFGTVVMRSAIALAIYLPAATWAADRWLRRGRFATIRAWLLAERPPTASERDVVLRYPLSSSTAGAVLWVLAAVAFSIIGTAASPVVALSIGVTVILGGLSTCAVSYLLAERILRPITARALAAGPLARPAAPGVATRLTMAWALATAVPLLGIAVLAITDLAGADIERGLLVGATLFLAGTALAVGLMAILISARSVADPLAALRRELRRVEHGDLEALIAVDDGSEVGLLQAGFNRMVGGLRERETLRLAFGTFVDPALTERVLAEGTDLAGEEVDVSIMFIDVRGFTAYAESAAAREVVGRLNELYGLIVPIILANQGHAMKFIGDGLLAVFGAPDRLPDHADRAVVSALQLLAAVDDRFAADLRVGVGINSGRVLAGTIGGGGRLDFTVIGDVVNTAARVESATRITHDDLLITQATRALLSGGADAWAERPAVALKGKREMVQLYAHSARSRRQPGDTPQ